MTNNVEQENQIESKSPVQFDKPNEITTVGNSEIVTVNSHTINSINLFDDKQLLAAENFLTRLIKSDKSGIKSVNDGLAILMRAQDLNLPFSGCIEHIHVINGKTGIDIHVIKALLLKAGCVWRCVKDYQPLYEYTDGINAYAEDKLPDYAVKCKSKEEADKLADSDTNKEHIYVYPTRYYQDLNGNIYKDYLLSTKQFAIAINKQQIASISQSGRIPVLRIPNQPIDYMTEYEFIRYREIYGKIVETKATGRFSYSEAQAADFFSKDTYNKYPRIMISHRAFTYGAREIASDILMGVMETTELKQINNIDLTDADIIEI